MQEEERTREPIVTSGASVILPKEQDSEEYAATTTPSVVEGKINRKGYCKTHLNQAKKRVIPSKVWKDRGGGRGYGYVTKRVTSYACKKRVITITLPHVYDAPVKGGLLIINNIKSRNLSEPGHDRNILVEMV